MRSHGSPRDSFPLDVPSISSRNRQPFSIEIVRAVFILDPYPVATAPGTRASTSIRRGWNRWSVKGREGDFEERRAVAFLGKIFILSISRYLKYTGSAGSGSGAGHSNEILDKRSALAGKVLDGQWRAGYNKVAATPMI